MATENNPGSEGATGRPDDSGVLAGRRRLLRGGLGAAPVVMMVASRSVMAGGAGGLCTPASSFASINASRPDQQYTCIGRTPGYWKQSQHFNAWVGYKPTGDKATLFDSVFGSRGGYSGKTLLDVLDMGGGGKDALARHIVAALLNAASGKTPGVLTVTNVIDIWKDYVNRGYYEPTAGIKWYAADITDWLKITMPV